MKVRNGKEIYDFGICGHFGVGHNFLDGQTVKTKTFLEELNRKVGKSNVESIDTYNWKKNPLRLFVNCFLLVKRSKRVLILPAKNGVKVLIPLFNLLNYIFRNKTYYIVIGGWLPELVRENKLLKYQLKKIDIIFVETHSMVEVLNRLGLNNVEYLPNFKRLEVLSKSSLKLPSSGPLKLCTFSRVMKEKGIEDAIEAVVDINLKSNDIIYSLDIYGQVDSEYEERFEHLKKKFPKFISYKGVIDFNESVDVLKDYFALLFPTYYEGEGFAGTILDSYASGLPVIATNWRYNSEIIENNREGILYDYENPDALKEILVKVSKNPELINNLKLNCLLKAEEFSPEYVINKFIKSL